MVRVKKRRVGAAPLWPMSSHKPDPSLVSFPVFFLEWKRMNGFPLCNMLEAEIYSINERHDPKSTMLSIAFVILPRLTT